MSLDITDRKQAGILLRVSQDTFRYLVETSPFGVYTVDADFRLAQVSAGAQKIFETVRPLIGRDFAEVMRQAIEQSLFLTSSLKSTYIGQR